MMIKILTKFMPPSRTNIALLIASLLTLSHGLQSARASESKKTVKDGRLECAVLKPISLGFLSNHVEAKKLDLEHEGRTIERFIKTLDPSKIYLRESDLSEIRGNLRGIFQRLGQDCSSINKSHQILVNRIHEATEFVKKTLNNDFKFQDNIELVLNSEQRKNPSTEKQAQDQLYKFIQFQISNYLASDMKLPEAKKQLIHRYEINSKRQAETTQDEIYSWFLDSYASALDAHSSYLSPDSLEDFEIQMKLSLEGIGAALTWEDGYTTVDNLIPGGSAERSGEIQPKDKIIAVAQEVGDPEPVIDMPLRDVVKLIRGKKGTTVRLTLLRQTNSETKRFIVALKRDKINLQDEAAKMSYTTKKVDKKTYKIGVLELPSFYGDLSRRTRSCFEDMKKLVLDAKKQKVDAIVLDLSKNGGGLLTEAVRIAGLFIKRGNIVGTQSSNGRFEPLPDEDDSVVFNGPLIILTSRLSASASEIVSGALKDYHRAVIVGSDHTFGKGTVQAMMNLPAQLGAIKVTTGMFFVPGGHSTQYRGVLADIVIPSPFSTKEIGEIALDYSLPPKKVDSFLSADANGDDPFTHWDPIDEATIKKLKQSSAQRVEKDPEFQKIKKELEEFEKRKGIIKLADSLKKQKEEKADPKKKLTGRRSKRQTTEEYLKQPDVNEAVLVAVDLLKSK